MMHEEITLPGWKLWIYLLGASIIGNIVSDIAWMLFPS